MPALRTFALGETPADLALPVADAPLTYGRDALDSLPRPWRAKAAALRAAFPREAAFLAYAGEVGLSERAIRRGVAKLAAASPDAARRWARLLEKLAAGGMGGFGSFAGGALAGMRAAGVPPIHGTQAQPASALPHPNPAAGGGGVVTPAMNAASAQSAALRQGKALPTPAPATWSAATPGARGLGAAALPGSAPSDAAPGWLGRHGGAAGRAAETGVSSAFHTVRGGLYGLGGLATAAGGALSIPFTGDAGRGFVDRSMQMADSGFRDLASLGGAQAVQRQNLANADTMATARPGDSFLGIKPQAAGRIAETAGNAAAVALPALGGAGLAGLGGSAVTGAGMRAVLGAAGRAAGGDLRQGLVLGGGMLAANRLMGGGEPGAAAGEAAQGGAARGPLTAEQIKAIPPEHAAALGQAAAERVPALTQQLSQLQPGAPVPPELQGELHDVVAGRLAAEAHASGNPDAAIERYRQVMQDGVVSPDEFRGIMQGPAGAEVAQAAKAQGSSPLDFFNGLEGWQKVALGVGLPLALIGAASGLFGGGGIGSLLMAALGLGGVGAGLGLFGGQGPLSGALGGLMGGGGGGAPAAAPAGGPPPAVAGAGAGLPGIPRAFWSTDDAGRRELMSMAERDPSMRGMFGELDRGIEDYDSARGHADAWYGPAATAIFGTPEQGLAAKAKKLGMSPEQLQALMATRRGMHPAGA
jgi:hypothetical protein